MKMYRELRIKHSAQLWRKLQLAATFSRALIMPVRFAVLCEQKVNVVCFPHRRVAEHSHLSCAEVQNLPQTPHLPCSKLTYRGHTPLLRSVRNVYNSDYRIQTLQVCLIRLARDGSANVYNLRGPRTRLLLKAVLMRGAS
jgi:hypothetical protein